MKNKNEFSVYVPFFPGFYGSIFDSTNVAYGDIQNEMKYYKDEYGIELNVNDLDFNVKEWENAVATLWCEAINSRLPECVVAFKFECISSSKYYNFSNDKLEAVVEMADNWEEAFRKFMSDNYDWLANRIREDWTSYSGFMSFMENNIDDWYKCLFEDHDARYVECMITYMMYKENNKIRDEISDEVFEEAYESSIYYFLTESGEEKVAAAEEKKKIKEFDEKYQLKIPFDEN